MKVTNLLQAEFNTKRPITGTILAARHTTCKENPKILIGKSNDFCLSFWKAPGNMGCHWQAMQFFHCYLSLLLIWLKFDVAPFPTRSLLLEYLWVASSLCFNVRLGAKLSIWKSSFILTQIKSIFKRKVLNVVLFWKWEFLNKEMAYHETFMHKILILYPDLLSALTSLPHNPANQKNWTFLPDRISPSALSTRDLGMTLTRFQTEWFAQMVSKHPRILLHSPLNITGL